MAFEEQITETIEAGAPSIKYEGDIQQQQQIAQQLWEQLPREAQAQFGSFEQFFSSGAWKKVLQMLQQQQQQGQQPQQMAQGPQQMAPGPQQPQGGIGSMMPAQMAYGGIAGADGRRAYGIGSWFQEKIMDPIKKNPLITAAVLGAGSSMIPGLPTSGWIGRALEGIKGKGITKGLGSVLSKPEWMIPAASLVAGAFAKPQEELGGGAMSRGAGINLQDIAKLANITDEQQGQAIGLNFLPEASARKYSPEEMALTYSQAGKAQGGRIGYAGGGNILKLLKRLMTPEGQRFKKFNYSQGITDDYKMDTTEIMEEMAETIYGKPYSSLNKKQQMKIFDAANEERVNIQSLIPEPDDFAQGGRIGAEQGGLMSLGGNEMDLRGGGFVPLGEQEKADDVPARLSKNEFVFTADAVRAAGGGNVDAGADKMYNTMKQLEGRVG